jgi:hypothetical protein
VHTPRAFEELGPTGRSRILAREPTPQTAGDYRPSDNRETMRFMQSGLSAGVDGLRLRASA